MTENRGEEEEYCKYWSKRVDNARVAPASEQYALFKEGRAHSSVRKKTCHQLWERMTVHWNGNVAPCHADIDGSTVLGNLGTQSIHEIWNGEEISRIRELHRQSKFEALPLCAGCDW
jgi:radical SAM protein with 4Fe4S-binding SPASM domain